MNLISKIALTLAATGMAAAPIAAQAVSPVAAPVSAESELGGGADAKRAFIILAIGAIGMGILLLTDDDEEPTSP